MNIKTIIRFAFKYFSYGRNARNGDIVMTAARHFWNGSLPLIGETTERELLRDPLLILLKCISETIDKNKYKITEARKLILYHECLWGNFLR